MELKELRRQKRKARIRGKVSGSKLMPRVSVYRSNSHIYAQLIDDQAQKKLCAYSDQLLKKGSKMEKAKQVGTKLAEIALSKKIKKVVFDRSGYKFHGRVKNLAEGAREGGLQF